MLRDFHLPLPWVDTPSLLVVVTSRQADEGVTEREPPAPPPPSLGIKTDCRNTSISVLSVPLPLSFRRNPKGQGQAQACQKMRWVGGDTIQASITSCCPPHSKRSPNLPLPLPLPKRRPHRLPHPPLPRTTRGSQHLPAHLPHPLLLLHRHQVLILAIRQRKRHADQQRRNTHRPRGAPREQQRRLDRRRARVDLVADPGAGRGRDDVAEGGEAVGQGLGEGVVV